tara:strand:+ start:467 stop:1564 length:1098 start_codon:yes stop_codon:yes gene_type:complete
MTTHKSPYLPILIIAILLGTFFLFRTPNKITNWLSERRPHQSLSFPERQSLKIKGDIHLLLKKFYPETAFIIAVNLDIPEHRIQKSKELTPNRIITQRQQKLNGDIIPQVPLRQSAQMLQQLYKDGLKLPGLITQRQSNESALPGFPGVVVESIKPSIPKEKIQKVNTSISEKIESIYYNETNETISSPKNIIQQMQIQILLDSASTQLIPIDTDTLKSLIQSISGFNPTRQDQLDIQYTPFQGPLFIIQRFLARHKPFFDTTKSFIAAQDFKLFITSILLLLLYFLTKLGLFLRRQIKEKKAAILKKQEDAQKKAALEAKRQLRLFKQKRKELANISLKKPEAVAHTIMGWIKDQEQEGDINNE